jgi:predicted transposase/invertase (TIGR01784 family)
MTELAYRLTNDTLFKMLFVKYPDLLKKMTAVLLGINFESIGEFIITNPEMPPEVMGDKFSRLDINMTVDGQRVNLEVQVKNEGDYPERSLYHWAREYSTALAAGNAYSELPRTVVISIIDFNLFDCVEFHSEYRVLEVTRHTLLTDRFCMHYFELPKLPDDITEDSELNIWLMLFKAKTIEEFKRLEDLEVPFVEQTIEAYRSITATDEFKELERMRVLARHNEASARKYEREQGREQGRKQEREKWQVVVADKDAVIADQKVENEKKDVALAEKDTAIAEKDTALAEKDTALAEKEALIADLMARLGEKK